MNEMEYKEIIAPDQISAALEKATELGQSINLQEVGYFDWLGKQTLDGWRPIWVSFRFPIILMEREVSNSEN